MNKNVFNLNTSRKSYLWAMFLPQILSIALVFVFSMFFKDVKEMSNSIIYLLSVMLIAQVGFFIIVYKFVKNNKITIKPIIKQKAEELSFKNIIICIVISVIAIVGLVHFVGLFNKIFEKMGYVASEFAMPNNTFGWFVVNVLISCVIPAILEELLFRGIIFNGLKVLGFWTATILSAVMFMTIHLNVESIIYPIIMGCVFCLIYKKTGNILYPIITHFCNNFIIKLIEYLNNVTGADILGIKFTSRWQYLIVVLVALVAVMLIFLIIKYSLNNTSNQNVENFKNDMPFLAEKTEEAESEAIDLKNNRYKLINTMLICGGFWLFMCIVSFI